jgi:sterol desaturase/sphingolipid hydroxylase (fatty acid hydroxylase superfamily)
LSDAGETNYLILRGGVLVLALVLGLALERWRPHAHLQPAWGTNLGLWATDSIVMAIACGACGWTVAAWAASRDLGLLALADAPRWLAIGVGVLGLDAVSYVWHRANHRLPILWRFHRVHHGDQNFHVTTALRFHPGELLLALPVRLATVVILGLPPEGVLAFELIFGVANLIEHGNFNLPHGWERRVRGIVVTPALHRRHHASDWEDLDTNFGTIFSLWDRLAATFRPSAPDRPLVTGLPDRAPGSSGLFEWLALPFARRAGR